MSTQLRLVEPPAPRATRSGRRGGNTGTGARSTGTRARAVRTAGKARRAPSWGDWQLDARTRRVGRQGVAAARRALDEARASHGLRRAS